MMWINCIETIINCFLVIGLFIGRNWLKAKIENSVRHKFNKEIENIRSELRNSEEIFKSELRSKETEISTLRDLVFSGRSNRQTLLNKRQIEAVEKIWAALVALAPYKAVSSMMSRVNLEFAAKEAVRDMKIREFFGMIAKMAPMPETPSNLAENEQPFVSPLAWAYFSAYKTVVITTYGTAKMLELGIKNSIDLWNHKRVEDLLKAALPHQSEYIEQYKTAGYHFLLDELEENLLTELKKILEGEDADKASVDKAVKIINMVKQTTDSKSNHENAVIPHNIENTVMPPEAGASPAQ